MSYEIEGKYYKDLGVKRVSDKFSKSDFVIETSETVNGVIYTNHLKFQLVNNRIQFLDRIKVGQNVRVYFNLRGNIPKDDDMKCVNNLDVWRIEKI